LELIYKERRMLAQTQPEIAEELDKRAIGTPWKEVLQVNGAAGLQELARWGNAHGIGDPHRRHRIRETLREQNYYLNGVENITDEERERAGQRDADVDRRKSHPRGLQRRVCYQT
jgi:hypothetical protein